MDAAFTGYVDVAQVVLYIFWIFFFGLIWYIRRTDRREGYPVEYEAREAYGATNFFWMAKPKEYILPHGHGSHFAPNEKRDDRPVAAERLGGPGAPFEPTGDPMVDAVGPAAYAQRDERPELTREGDLLIVPMRVAEDYEIFKPSKDVRGMDVLANDRTRVGTVKDIWVDRADQMVRYLEVELEGGEGARLLPMFSALIRDDDTVTVASLKAEHFPKIPKLANPDQVGVLEEDQIMAFYAGGRMYATTFGYGPLV
ncbi:MAG: photosynthetic reaction center subunit H [Myxococcota bacterium]